MVLSCYLFHVISSGQTQRTRLGEPFIWASMTHFYEPAITYCGLLRNTASDACTLAHAAMSSLCHITLERHWDLVQRARVVEVLVLPSVTSIRWTCYKLLSFLHSWSIYVGFLCKTYCFPHPISWLLISKLKETVTKFEGCTFCCLL